jgi:hypothetical protein
VGKMRAKLMRVAVRSGPSKRWQAKPIVLPAHGASADF